MIKRLQKRWGLSSSRDLIIVFLVFSLAGLSILPARAIVFQLLGVGEQTPIPLRVLIWILVVFPAYQLFLLGYGALFGRFQFFWEKEKRLIRWLGGRLGLLRTGAG